MTKTSIPRLWITPVNDGEAVEIRNLLHRQGERFFETKQPWGANWEGLEPAIVKEIETLFSKGEYEVIGVELAGPARFGGRNIDHHFYQGEDRRNPLSSIEQVACLLGVTLNRHQQLVAINDVGWIPALIACGASPSEIEVVRAQDRCAQGVNPDEEAQAVRDIAQAKWQERKVLVTCPKGATSAHTDRLWGDFKNPQGAFDELLTCGGDKWVYYGPRARELVTLQLAEKHWSGGKAPREYFGVIDPSIEAQEKILKSLLGMKPLPISPVLKYTRGLHKPAVT